MNSLNKAGVMIVVSTVSLGAEHLADPCLMLKRQKSPQAEDRADTK
jgi:hypothetical protein